jgi:uncharacterized protein DUF4384
MLMSLLLLHTLGASAAPAATRSVAPDPPVRVWFNSHGDYQYGDRAKVYAQAVEDGNLVVLRADAGGQVRVLFPINPDGAQQVRGGKKYELKGRGGRDAFVVDDTSGHGTVLAAVSGTPFQFAQFEKNGHWDYSALGGEAVRADPEAGLTDLVERMRGTGEHFDYDVATYTASPAPRYVGLMRPYAWGGWWDPWYHDYWYGPRLGVGLRFGTPFFGRGRWHH